MEIPITPPSIMLFGSKNASSANAAIKAPSVINNILKIISLAISNFVLGFGWTFGFFANIVIIVYSRVRSF